MTSGSSSLKNDLFSPSQAYNQDEHGIGLRIAALRLGQTSLVITKTSPSESNGLQYLTIAMISVRFVKNSASEHLIVPMLCYKIECKSSCISVTPHSDIIFDQIRQQFGDIFHSEYEMLQYGINQIGLFGTHIFVADLKMSAHHKGQYELLSKSNDIVYQCSTEDQNLSQLVTSKCLLESSLSQYLRFMYLKHPQFLRVSINGHPLPQSTLQNPYNQLMV